MSSGQGQSGGAEQRRYVRVPLNLDGLLAIGSRPPVPCTVRDFCAGGMFISADPAHYASAEAQTPAVLYFALFVGGEKHDYQISLAIARVVAKGIGVSFVDPDQQTLDLLGQLAAPAAPPESAGTEAPGGPADDFAARHAEVAGPLKALIAEEVRKLVERFIERVDEQLFLAARDAGNNVDETRFLDGQREMRGRQERIRGEVPANLERGVETLRNPFADQDKDASSLGMSDLSLIEKDEFEDFLAVSEMVSELEPEFSGPLLALRHRLSFLANRELDATNLPIGPNVLCTAFSECIKGLQSDRPVVARVYRVLHETMSRHLDGFYERVNALLVEHGIVPVIDPEKPVFRKSPAASGGFDAEASPPPVAEEDDLTDLMPGPEGYDTNAQAPAGGGPATPTPRAAGGVQAAPPNVPAGVQAAPPNVPAGVQAAPPGVAGGVQAAPPRVPGGVQAAPPSVPGGVQAAPPNVPAGVQAAPPGVPGGVQAAPPGVPGGVQAAPPGVAGGVQAAPPGVPGGIQAAPPSVPGSPALEPLEGTQPGADGVVGAATPGGVVGGGWAAPPAQYAAPTMQRAYSAAQTQLALRRELLPEGAGTLSDTVRQRGAYSTTQIAQGLYALQQDYAVQDSGDLLDAEGVKDRITRALIEDGAPEKTVEGEAVDAIEVVANLFNALLRDAMLARNAQSHLTRLQPAVHRAALLDPEFFESTDHPVRQVINRVSRVRDGDSEGQQQRNQQVRELVSRANREFRDDLSVFDDVLAELDGVIEAQEGEYRAKVADVVQSCEEQQQILESRRGHSLEETDGAGGSDLPEEWNKWLERSRKLEVGQRVMMNANSPRAAVATLVWKEARNNLFVFVDEQGNKSSTLTLQQVAMYLRRGILRILDRSEESPALERAMVGVVERLHTQVEEHATRDPLTGFLLRKFFVDAIDAAQPDTETQAARNAAVCEIAIENLAAVAQEHGEAAGEALRRALAEELKQAVRGRDIVFGVLADNLLGIYWPTGGIQGAYKKMQATLEALQGLSIKVEADGSIDADATDITGEATDAQTLVRPFKPVLVAGISGGDDGLVQAEGLLAAAHEACETAREMGPGSIYVAGGENEQRRQLEQLVAWANGALERGDLSLHGQFVSSLSDAELPPSVYVAVGTVDRGGKPIPAQVFAPAVARCEMAAEIDLWTFRRTLAWMLAHEDELEQYALVVVPLSSASMRNEDLPHLIMSEFMETPVPPGRICFAIPDHDVVENVVEAGELISTLKEFGCRFVLDEFGSGHENYDYIKSLDVDFVTVKTSFITDASSDAKDFAMAKSINELVHFMGKKTIARQAPGGDLREVMTRIGIDFLHDQTDHVTLTQGESGA